MSDESNNQRSSRYIPLNTLHPILKDLYSTHSSLSSELELDTVNSKNRAEHGVLPESELEILNVNYIRGNRFPRYHDKRQKKKIENVANKVVDEVIRLALEKLKSDSNSDAEEFFDAEENINRDDPNSGINIIRDSQISTGLVSDSSQTDLIIDPNHVLEIVDTNDSATIMDEEVRYEDEGGTGDVVRKEKYCRVTTECEQCEVYLLNCYKYQCKLENLSIYSSTLEKKVQDYVALLNNYNTRLMTSRLLIKQSNGKQNELMLRCDELQEKWRVIQAENYRIRYGNQE